MSTRTERLRLAGRLAAAVAWRTVWAVEDKVRSFLWGGRLGFEMRPTSSQWVSVIESRRVGLAAASSRLPRTSCLGVIARDPGGGQLVLAETGRFYGLEVRHAAIEGAAALLDRAVHEGWPVVGLAMEGVESLPEPVLELVHAYLDEGGTLIITGLTASGGALHALSGHLGITVPEGRSLDRPATEVVFSARHPAFTQEFAGFGVEDSSCRWSLSGAIGSETLAWIRSAGNLYPAVAGIACGHGRVVLSAGASTISRLSQAMAPLQALTVLPVMMAVRQVYGETAWRPPMSLANFLIDDPALRGGRLGLDYKRILEQAREHGIHVTVATIPRELGVASPDVVALMRANSRWLSACYHGSDHSGYEFYLPEAHGKRYRARPIAAQQLALHRAVNRGERFAHRTGFALDRVMVFPHGVGSPLIFATLQSLGFLSACNFDDRYPLGAQPPQDYDLGMRAADLGWAGFPLIWRRGLQDPMFVLDLFLGRPAITFGHKGLAPDLEPFAQRADDLHRVSNGGVQWASLEDVSRHCYLQRYDPIRGWEVSMLSNEICLHNPDSRSRTYRVERPNRPDGYLLTAGSAAEKAEGLEVTVAAGASQTVRLAGSHSRLVSPARVCSLDGVAAQRSSA